MIWYKDQILKNFSLEAMTIELQTLKRQIRESEERRERLAQSRNYQTIVFRKPEERKAEDAEEAQNAETSEASKADDPEDAK